LVGSFDVRGRREMGVAGGGGGGGGGRAARWSTVRRGSAATAVGGSPSSSSSSSSSSRSGGHDAPEHWREAAQQHRGPSTPSRRQASRGAGVAVQPVPWAELERAVVCVHHALLPRAP